MAVLLSSLGIAAPSAANTPPFPQPTPKPTPKPAKPKPTPWPVPAGVKGLDVSHWNGFPDFRMLHGQGMRFVFSKASQGVWKEDNTFQRHTQEARAAGLVAGAYHFFDYRKGGVKQARHYLSTLRKTTGLERLMRLVVDVETLKTLGTPNKFNAKKRLHDLLDELYRQTGRYPMIYTSQTMWQRVVGAPASFGAYPLWVACWECDTIHLPNGWTSWRFWQADQFKFPGNVKLDGNVYSSDIPNLQAEQARPMRVANGRGWTSTRAVNVDISAFDGTQARVAVGNGSFGAWRPYQPQFGVQLGAKQGNKKVRVQLRSFRGVASVAFEDQIMLDSIPPKLSGPNVSMVSGKRLSKKAGRVPSTVKVKAKDKGSGVKSSKAKAICGSASRGQFSKSPSVSFNVALDRAGCTLVGGAKDLAGGNSSKQIAPKIGLLDARAGAKRLSLTGAWKTMKSPRAINGTLARTSSRGAKLKMKMYGAQFAIVARRGPTGGRFDVIVDGKRAGTVSLYSKKQDNRRVVYVKNVPRGKHIIKLVAKGSGVGQSKGKTVWIDSMLVLNRRK